MDYWPAGEESGRCVLSEVGVTVSRVNELIPCGCGEVLQCALRALPCARDPICDHRHGARPSRATPCPVRYGRDACRSEVAAYKLVELPQVQTAADADCKLLFTELAWGALASTSSQVTRGSKLAANLDGLRLGGIGAKFATHLPHCIALRPALCKTRSLRSCLCYVARN